MKKKRERLDVINDILDTIRSKKEIGPTRLLQLSNLSPKMFRDYIEELINTRLIIEHKINNKRSYHLTKKGFIFLERYHIFSNFIEQVGL